MRISVFGLGYVGAVCGACLARGGHSIVGVDISSDKVDLINAGQSPIVEKDLPEYIRNATARGLLRATTSAAEAVEQSELSFICVGTPSRRNGAPNLDYVRKVCAEIGESIRNKTGYHIVVMRSTAPPGTVRDVIIPALEAASGRFAGEGFGVASNPEFLREGSAVHDFHHPPKIVIGEFDTRSADAVESIYADLDAPLLRLPLDAAEMVKYADNAWHATKVVFANEIGNLCKEMGVDGHVVMDALCKDHKLNISPAYLRPGFAFGGSCLPKDVRAICHRARSLDVELPLIESLMSSNRLQVARALSMVEDVGGRKVGMLGLSFKSGTDDVRESPMVELCERLLGKGYDLKIYDRSVSMAGIHGANRDFLLAKIPHVMELLMADIDAVLDHADTLVVGNGATEFMNVAERLRDDQVLVDLVRVSARTTDGRYQGICW